MQPLGKLVLIELAPESKEKATESGFLFQAPKWAKPTNVAKVLARGPEVSAVADGDMILINPYAVLDTEEALIKLVQESDILCLVKQQAEV